MFQKINEESRTYWALSALGLRKYSGFRQQNPWEIEITSQFQWDEVGINSKWIWDDGFSNPLLL